MAIQLQIAQEILLNLVAPIMAEKVSLADCWQRVLAETLIADIDFPPFDRSPLDGYAVVASEVIDASPDCPITLREIDNVPAGSIAKCKVVSGTACRIMTGAPIPLGATGVVRLEDVELSGKYVRVAVGRGADKNICRQGEEIRAGDTVVRAGTIVGAGTMGMLAMLGKPEVLVFCRPKVGLIATGSELVSVAQPLVPGKIRNSNSYMLSGQVKDAGAEPIIMESVCDNIEAIVKRIQSVPECDVYITTGGVSVGDYDVMRQVFEALGIPILFDRVNMKPGMPVLAGVKQGKLYIGLSGNPAAASIAFEQLVRPVLLKLAGRTEWRRPCVKALLKSQFSKGSEAKRFVWAYCQQRGQRLVVEPLLFQGNGMLKSAIAANSLIIVPENSSLLEKGAEVEVIMLIN